MARIFELDAFHTSFQPRLFLFVKCPFSWLVQFMIRWYGLIRVMRREEMFLASGRAAAAVVEEPYGCFRLFDGECLIPFSHLCDSDVLPAVGQTTVRWDPLGQFFDLLIFTLRVFFLLLILCCYFFFNFLLFEFGRRGSFLFFDGGRRLWTGKMKRKCKI